MKYQIKEGKLVEATREEKIESMIKLEKMAKKYKSFHIYRDEDELTITPKRTKLNYFKIKLASFLGFDFDFSSGYGIMADSDAKFFADLSSFYQDWKNWKKTAK